MQIITYPKVYTNGAEHKDQQGGTCGKCFSSQKSSFTRTRIRKNLQPKDACMHMQACMNISEHKPTCSALDVQFTVMFGYNVSTRHDKIILQIPRRELQYMQKNNKNKKNNSN